MNAGGGERTLDTRGELCPQPIIDLAREVRTLPPGGELVVISDDLAFPPDVRAWCAGTGNELLELTGDEGVHRALIRKVGI